MLEVGKVLMQDFNYNYIKNDYSCKAEMSLTDSDSLMYKIYSEII